MSAYLEKGREVQLKFSAQDISTDKMNLDADFKQLDEAFRTESKRKKKKFSNGSQAPERLPFTIDCQLNRLSTKMKFLADGEALHTFMMKYRMVSLEMILTAKFDDGVTIYCKMDEQHPGDSRFHFRGTVSIGPSQMFLADQTYKCQVSVEIVDAELFEFMEDCFEAGAKLHSFLEDNRFCDFTIIADNGAVIKSHKVILAAGSPVLERMLGTECVETRENRLQLDVSEATIKTFLKFIYGVSVEDVFQAPDIAVELVELAHKYDVGELEKSMMKLILKRADEWLNIDAGLKLFLYSVHKDGDEYQELKEKGLRVLKAERDGLNESTVFQRLLREEPDTITNLFKVILQS